MKRVLFTSMITIFAAIFFTRTAMPASMSGLNVREAQSNTQIAMEKTKAGKAISEEDKILYNPEVAYPGVYEAKRLYYKGHESDVWKGISKPAFLKDVTCSDAKKALSISGIWNGRLNKNGSCGAKAEPAELAVGNYLNFKLTPDSEKD